MAALQTIVNSDQPASPFAHRPKAPERFGSPQLRLNLAEGTPPMSGPATLVFDDTSNPPPTMMPVVLHQSGALMPIY